MTRRLYLPLILCSLLLTGAGCSVVPSGWNLFGTPISRVEKAEVKQEQAQAKVLLAVQEEVHKVTFAAEAAVAGNPHGLNVALQHARTARSLVDQALGNPTVESESRWRDLIARQTSLDDKIRTLAEEENAKRLKQIAALSTDLQAKSTALEAANQRAQQYALELQSFKDSVLKVAWIVGAFFILYFLGQILQFAANFSPAFGTAANVVNAVVSPALHAGFHRARKAAASVIAPKADAS